MIQTHRSILDFYRVLGLGLKAWEDFPGFKSEAPWVQVLKVKPEKAMLGQRPLSQLSQRAC